MTISNQNRNYLFKAKRFIVRGAGAGPGPGPDPLCPHEETAGRRPVREYLMYKYMCM